MTDNAAALCVTLLATHVVTVTERGVVNCAACGAWSNDGVVRHYAECQLETCLSWLDDVARNVT